MSIRFSLAAAFVAAGTLASGLAYSHLPATIPVHWNGVGQPDGFASKGVALTILPIAGLATIAICWFITRRSKAAEQALPSMAALVSAFLMLVHGQLIAAATTVSGSISLAVLFGGLGIMYLFVGRMMASLQPNPFVGIRTPWTLGNETVWKVTHQLAAKTMIAAGLFTIMVALVLPSGSVLTALALTFILGGALVPAAASYFINRTYQQRHP